MRNAKCEIPLPPRGEVGALSGRAGFDVVRPRPIRPLHHPGTAQRHTGQPRGARWEKRRDETTNSIGWSDLVHLKNEETDCSGSISSFPGGWGSSIFVFRSRSWSGCSRDGCSTTSRPRSDRFAAFIARLFRSHFPRGCQARRFAPTRRVIHRPRRIGMPGTSEQGTLLPTRSPRSLTANGSPSGRWISNLAFRTSHLGGRGLLPAPCSLFPRSLSLGGGVGTFNVQPSTFNRWDGWGLSNFEFRISNWASGPSHLPPFPPTHPQ